MCYLVGGVKNAVLDGATVRGDLDRNKMVMP